MKNLILSMKLENILKRTKKQFAIDKGIHLNSQAWKSHIDTTFPTMFQYLSSGLLTFTTYTDISKQTYKQGFRNTHFRVIELCIFFMLLVGVPEDSMVKMVKQLFLKSNWKCSCLCAAFVYFGYKYILTQEDSLLGKPENRFPKIRNPKLFGLTCKHLWVTVNYFNDNMDKIIRDIIPNVRKLYGINHITGKNKILKKIGSNGVKKAYIQCQEKLYKFDASLVGMFNAVVVRHANKTMEELEKERFHEKK